ncbi:MAG: hypothetical protein KAT68_19575 [Bacteroidales bacterium]|nr:hypothetical protein [Bacteroidales bacterium]
MIQVYRSWEKVEGSILPEQYYDEICRICAKEEQKKGRDIQFDDYLSNIEPLSREETCQICEGTFFIDGRIIKNNEPLNDS